MNVVIYRCRVGRVGRGRWSSFVRGPARCARGLAWRRVASAPRCAMRLVCHWAGRGGGRPRAAEESRVGQLRSGASAGRSRHCALRPWFASQSPCYAPHWSGTPARWPTSPLSVDSTGVTFWCPALLLALLHLATPCLRGPRGLGAAPRAVPASRRHCSRRRAPSPGAGPGWARLGYPFVRWLLGSGQSRVGPRVGPLAAVCSATAVWWLLTPLLWVRYRTAGLLQLSAPPYAGHGDCPWQGAPGGA